MVNFPPRPDPSASEGGVQGTGAREDDTAPQDRAHVPPPCADRHLRPLLLPYALSCCDEDDAIEFEAHLLQCEACFQDIQCLDRAGHLIQEALLSGLPVADRVQKALDARGRALRRPPPAKTKRPAR